MLGRNIHEINANGPPKAPHALSARRACRSPDADARLQFARCKGLAEVVMGSAAKPLRRERHRQILTHAGVILDDENVGPTRAHPPTLLAEPEVLRGRWSRAGVWCACAGQACDRPSYTLDRNNFHIETVKQVDE